MGLIAFGQLHFDGYSQQQIRLAIGSGATFATADIDHLNLPVEIDMLWHVSNSQTAEIDLRIFGNLGVTTGIERVQKGFSIRQLITRDHFRISSFVFSTWQLPLALYIIQPLDGPFFLKNAIGYSLNNSNPNISGELFLSSAASSLYTFKINGKSRWYSLVYCNLEFGKLLKSENALSISISYYYGFHNVIDMDLKFDNGTSSIIKQILFKGDYLFIGLLYSFRPFHREK